MQPSEQSQCPATSQTWNVIVLVVSTVVFLILFVGIVAPVIEWERQYRWICPTCGAQKQMTEHKLWGTSYPAAIDGIPTGKTPSMLGIVDSPLTAWMDKHGIAHKHTWAKTSDLSYGLFRLGKHFRCSTVPPMYDFMRLTMDYFVHNAPEDEIRHLLEALKGNPEAAKAEIAEIQKTCFNQMLSRSASSP